MSISHRSSLSLSSNPVLSKVFSRVDGLLAIVVTDSEGSVRLKCCNRKSLKEDESLDSYDTSFPSTFIIAYEQISKIPNFGKCEFVTAIYEDYAVVQFLMNQQKSKTSGSSDSGENSGEFTSLLSASISSSFRQKQQFHEPEGDDDDDDDDECYITLIARNNTNTQLLIDLAPSIRKIVKQL